MVNPAEAQADYYNKTASDNENMRGSWDDLLHDEALCIMLALCQKHNVHSILDVSAGMGRIISRIAQTQPNKALSEMLRVSRKGIFISDANNWAQGSKTKKYLRWFMRQTHLWSAAKFVQNGFKPYMESEGDGISYSYSIFDSLAFLRTQCPRVYFFSLSDISRTNSNAVLHQSKEPDLRLSVTHGAILALKEGWI